MASDFITFAATVTSTLCDRSYQAEVAEEILDHLECAAADLEAAGVEPEEARRQAMAAFGDPVLVGRRLQQAGKGGRQMKFARIGGMCALLGGAVMIPFNMVDYAGRHGQLSVLARGTLFQIISASVLVWFGLLVAALVCLHALHLGSRREKQVLIGITVAAACLGLLFGQVPYVLSCCCCLMAAGTLRTGLLHAAGHNRTELAGCAVAALACLILAAGAHPIYESLSRPVQDVWDWAIVIAWLAVGALQLTGALNPSGAKQRLA